MIIEKTYNLLKTRYNDRIEKLMISDVRIGVFMTAVRLSDNSCGSSSTLVDDSFHCVKNKRNYGDFSPLKIKGKKVCDLFETEIESNIILTLKIAVLNAISSGIISTGNYKIIENCDPVDLLDLNAHKTITIVGAFHSYIKKIAETGNKLYILELNKNALTDEEKKYFVPANDFKKVFDESDIIIITGLTLVNKTIDNLLTAIPDKTLAIVTGPSSSIIPDVLFANKINIIGSTRITKPDVLLDLVSEAGGGFHLFDYCAKKICILRDYEI
jgi:uncharacterized protein (DUF4213/DUF364 family)